MRNPAIALLFCARVGCITPQERTAVYNLAELVPYSRTGTEKIMAINAQPLEKVKLATLPDSYSSAQS